MNGLTQSELTVIIMIGLIAGLPCGIVLSVLWENYRMAGFLAGFGGVGVGVGAIAMLYVQQAKADTPSGYLMQKMQVLFFRKKWVPTLGPYYYKRSSK
jgi:conjugative transfer region protein (TIGR03750 family)